MTKRKKEYVIVRAHTAGVHAGFLKSRKGDTLILEKSRRLWKWYGASLSQRELALVLKTNYGYVSQVESGRFEWPICYFKKLKKFMSKDEVQQGKAIFRKMLEREIG